MIRRNKKPKFDNIARYFNKEYSFSGAANWKLPPDVFTTKSWVIYSMLFKKSELNEVKALLDEYDLMKWSKHTKSRDPSTAVLNKLRIEYDLELQTQAWCKFYEIVSQFQLVPLIVKNSGKLKSLHLCEAPGAFVCALNHYLACNFPTIEWKWTANTLNPYYEGNSEKEMIADDRFIKFTLDNWYFCNDFTGNITTYDNHLSLVNEFINDEILLITADGSVDCMLDPGNQENHVAYLHYCETMTALRILSIGGSFLLKIFTMFEESTICLLYLLNCTFEQVHVFKPLTSKSGNSEVYVICLNYYGREKIENWDRFLLPYKIGLSENSMFRLEAIPEDFLAQLRDCSDYFMKLQIAKIKDNIKYFGKTNGYSYMKKFNNAIAEHFVIKYSLSNISKEKKILYNTNQDILNKTTNRSRFYELLKIDCESKLDLKFGKKYNKILHSNYSSNEKLCNFNFKRNNTKFYNVVLSNLACSYNIVNITHKNVEDISKFHESFVCEIKNFIEIESSRDLITIGPFISNIQVGILHLLANHFQTTIFLNIGCVLFKNLSNLNKNKLIEQLDLIQNGYVNLKNDFDLLQIISFNQILKSGLFATVLQYNNNFAKYWQLL